MCSSLSYNFLSDTESYFTKREQNLSRVGKSCSDIWCAKSDLSDALLQTLTIFIQYRYEKSMWLILPGICEIQDWKLNIKMCYIIHKSLIMRKDLNSGVRNKARKWMDRSFLVKGILPYVPNILCSFLYQIRTTKGKIFFIFGIYRRRTASLIYFLPS